MVRIIIIVLVLWVIVRIARSLLRARDAGRRVEHALSRCDYCGLHVPAEEAVREGDRTYCSEAHRRAALTRET